MKSNETDIKKSERRAWAQIVSEAGRTYVAGRTASEQAFHRQCIETFGRVYAGLATLEATAEMAREMMLP